MGGKINIEDGFHHQNNQHRQFEMAVEEEKCGGNQHRQLEAGDICSGVTNLVLFTCFLFVKNHLFVLFDWKHITNYFDLLCFE